MIGRAAWLACVIATGCTAPLGSDDQTDAGSNVTPVASFVTAPVHGAVMAGDPRGLSIHVAGVYADASHTLSVQVLADPDDLASWTTIGTAQAAAVGDHFEFATDVVPVRGDADAARWPAGGVLRLEVTDGDGLALPYDPATPDDDVIAVVNPAGAPEAWAYLTEKPGSTSAETSAYYTAIDAPKSLAAFQARFGFADGDPAARYYNAGDLGIGRDMHCRATDAPAGGVACYVSNYGSFGGSKDDAIAQLVGGGTPFATVAMVYAPPIDAPNAVTFMVYAANGKLTTKAQLDTHGDNTNIPNNCLNCHGGRSRYDATAHAAIGARFLPFDPAAFAFADAPGMSLVEQQPQLAALNDLVTTTSPTAATTEVIDGTWSGGTYSADFVPVGWRDSPSDRRVYQQVVAPYCRGCHTTFAAAGGADPATFATAAGLRAAGAGTLSRVCGTGPRGMPAAEATAGAMFGSSARAVLLTWLDAPGACAP